MSSANWGKIRTDKIARLRHGGAPRVLEICSGCGGLSLGLQTAGFELAAHIESDPEAAESYALNFGSGSSKDDPWSRPRDMKKSDARELVKQLGLRTSSVHRQEKCDGTQESEQLDCAAPRTRKSSACSRH